MTPKITKEYEEFESKFIEWINGIGDNYNEVLEKCKTDKEFRDYIIKSLFKQKIT